MLSKLINWLFGDDEKKEEPKAPEAWPFPTAETQKAPAKSKAKPKAKKPAAKKPATTKKPASKKTTTGTKKTTSKKK